MRSPGGQVPPCSERPIAEALVPFIGRKLAAVVQGGVAFAGDDAAPPKARLVAETSSSGYRSASSFVPDAEIQAFIKSSM